MSDRRENTVTRAGNFEKVDFVAPAGAEASARGAQPRGLMPLKNRLLVLQLVALAHVALLLLWLPRVASSTPIMERETGDRNSTLTLYSFPRASAAPSIAPVQTTPAPAPPADQDDPTAPIAHPEDLGLPGPSTDLAPDPLTDKASVEASPQTAQPGVKCNLVVALQSALQGNPNVDAALASIPRGSRSVANAIMLWDGAWVTIASPAGEAPLAPLRSAIVEGLRAAPQDCREATNQGPILIPITGTPGTTVLALGSGSWRAIDLINQSDGVDGAFP